MIDFSLKNLSKVLSLDDLLIESIVNERCHNILRYRVFCLSDQYAESEILDEVSTQR